MDRNVPVAWSAACFSCRSKHFRTHRISSFLAAHHRMTGNKDSCGSEITPPRTPRLLWTRHYIETTGEDAQNFRAIAERSTIPDYTKDGGIAAVDPALTQAWRMAEAIDAGLATMPDEQRRNKLARARCPLDGTARSPRRPSSPVPIRIGP